MQVATRNFGSNHSNNYMMHINNHNFMNNNHQMMHNSNHGINNNNNNHLMLNNNHNIMNNNNQMMHNSNHNMDNNNNNNRAAVCMSAELFIEQMKQKVMYADHYLTMRGYHVQQQHGQRISVNRSLSPAELDSALKARYNEIFIGKLPRDLFEDELLPSLEFIGRVYKIRYMMDFSNSNRGFCFVQYTTVEEAAMACRMLNNMRVRPDKDPIGVRPSFDNRTLFFGNLPPDCTESRLVRALQRYNVEGIVDAQMADTTSNGKTHYHYRRGQVGRNQMFNNMGPLPPVASTYCHVYFESHDAATKARRQLLPGVLKLFGRKLTCDWGKPDRPKEVMDLLDENRNYIRNSSASV